MHNCIYPKQVPKYFIWQPPFIEKTYTKNNKLFKCILESLVQSKKMGGVRFQRTSRQGSFVLLYFKNKI